LAELMSIVAQETDVATKTRMNSDYVPGMVTVLEGDDLEALGVATAGEALGLVPGIFAARTDRGDALAIVRGIDFQFNSGNILILIDSIPIVRADAAINSVALQMPVEQIERIEVIRGSGSIVYGDYAFMGLVNIVTRKEAIRLFTRFATPRVALEGGARIAGKLGGSSFAVNAARYTSNNTPLPIRQADEERRFGIVSFNRGGLSLEAQTVRHELVGSNAGQRLKETSWALDGAYTRQLATGLRGEGRVTFTHSNSDDFISQFTGGLMRLTATAFYDGWARHSILLSADSTQSSIDVATHRTPPPPGRPAGPPLSLVRNGHRHILGITLQDRFDVRDRLAITLGGRYDSYSDFDERFTPRAAIVWRASDQHIFKAQYAEGFRPPTFFELYQPPAPGSRPRYAFEVNATTELNYIYRSAGRVGRATIFHSNISNMIRPGGVLTDPNAAADGVELEWTQQIAPALRIDANASFVDDVDPRVPGPGFPRRSNPTTPQTMANAALFYRPSRGVVVGGRWSHIGDRRAAAGFDTLDLTISREDVLRPGLQIRVGVRNAADAHITYATLRPNGDATASTFPRRSLWLQVSYRR
jgi:iron complex outermembrane receptor protein